MESRDFVYLQEAYQQMYQLDEEVEIATEYFYEMGLNEYGVNALIEELGVEEFVDWVYDIAESYYLEEETRLQRMSGRKNKILTGPKGSRPQSTTKAREKKQGGVTMRTSGGPKSTMRKRAVRAAAETQPETREAPAQEKSGIARAIQGVRDLQKGWKTVTDPISRVSTIAARKAIKATGKKINADIKTLGRATGTFVGARRSGATTTSALARGARELFREDEEFEAWVEGLWEEGYDLSDYTWEGLYEAYIEEANRGERELGLTSKERARKRNLEYRIGFMWPDQRPDKSVTYPKTKSSRKRVFGDKGYLLHPNDNDQKSARRRHKLIRGQRGEEHIERRGTKTRGVTQESYEAYNTILEYLLNEGYADTIESAESIMNSMSEEWIADILES